MRPTFFFSQKTGNRETLVLKTGKPDLSYPLLLVSSKKTIGSACVHAHVPRTRPGISAQTNADLGRTTCPNSEDHLCLLLCCCSKLHHGASRSTCRQWCRLDAPVTPPLLSTRYLPFALFDPRPPFPRLCLVLTWRLGYLLTCGCTSPKKNLENVPKPPPTLPRLCLVAWCLAFFFANNLACDRNQEAVGSVQCNIHSYKTTEIATCAQTV